VSRQRVDTVGSPQDDLRAVLTPDDLFGAPLPQLLAKLDVTLDESTITDERFRGAAVVARDRLFLSMPPDQPSWERDALVRALLGKVLNVPLSLLPEPYRLTEV